MRPASIDWFDRLFLGSLILGIANSALSFSKSMELMQQSPGGEAFGPAFMIGTLAVSMAISLLLWFLIARRASTVAKWFLVVITVFGALMIVPSIGMLAETRPLSLVLSLVITALQLAAITFLFRSDAATWFASKGRNETDDPTIFS